jgi:hypothetical protein
MRIHIATIIALAAFLPGCASIFQGRLQNISVQSTPESAHCDLFRKAGHPLSVSATPAMVTVTRTKNDIVVTCQLAGYRPARQRLHSGVSGMAIGNVLLGGFIGWSIDPARGTDNEYPFAINLQMGPVSASLPGG